MIGVFVNFQRKLNVRRGRISTQTRDQGEKTLAGLVLTWGKPFQPFQQVLAEEELSKTNASEIRSGQR